MSTNESMASFPAMATESTASGAEAAGRGGEEEEEEEPPAAAMASDPAAAGQWRVGHCQRCVFELELSFLKMLCRTLVSHSRLVSCLSLFVGSPPS